MSTNAQSPCVEIPSITIPSVSLPMGIELQAIADFSKGPPTNCALLTNLIGQLMPTLAGLNCIIKILGVIAALEGLITGLTSVPPDFSKAKKVLDAIEKLAPCLSMVLGPVAVFQTIKDILTLIISYLKCFVDAIKSVLDFQAGIDLSSAQGNPDLLKSLQCASDNAQTTMEQMMMALGPIDPLIEMVQPLIDLSQLPIKLPSMSQISGSKDVSSAVDQLDSILTTLQQVLATIP